MTSSRSISPRQLIILCLSTLLILAYSESKGQIVKKFYSLDEALVSPLSVEWLDLTDDKLESLPSRIFELENLRFLNISGNPIRIIPTEISRLSKLQVLYLNNDPYLNLDLSIYALSKLPALEELHLANDNIHSFGNEFESLNKLKYLDLSGNPIEFTDFQIRPLQNLILILDQDPSTFNQLNSSNLQNETPAPSSKLKVDHLAVLYKQLRKRVYFESMSFHKYYAPITNDEPLLTNVQEDFITFSLDRHPGMELYPITLKLKTSN
jgi:Leucine-rich repeat (LRR) protein